MLIRKKGKHVGRQPGVSATPETRNRGPRKGQQPQQWMCGYVMGTLRRRYSHGNLGEKHPKQGGTAENFEEGSSTWGGRERRVWVRAEKRWRKVQILFSGQWKVTEMF